MDNKSVILMEVIKLPQSNQYLPEPFRLGEKVKFLSDVEREGQSESFNKQFIKIKRFKTGSVQTENRDCFKLLGKTK